MLNYDSFKKELFEAVCNDKWIKENNVFPYIGYDFGQEYLSSRKDGMFLDDSPVLLLLNLYDNYMETRPRIKDYADRAVFYLRCFYEKMDDWIRQPREALDKRIFFRVTSDRRLAGSCASVNVLGLDVIFGYKVDDNIDIFITTDMMRKLGYKIEELQFLAQKNTPELFPVKTIDSANLAGYDSGARVVLVSNTAGKYGASTIFYPGLLESLSAELGRNRGFFVFLYDSNCMAVTASYPDREVEPWNEPRTTVRFKEAERFCDTVYYFDAASKRLKMARNSEKRKMGSRR